MSKRPCPFLCICIGIYYMKMGKTYLTPSRDNNYGSVINRESLNYREEHTAYNYSSHLVNISAQFFIFIVKSVLCKGPL